MNIALHHLVMHQPVDDVGAFPLGRAEHGGVPQQVALVTEGAGKDASATAVRSSDHSSCNLRYSAFLEHVFGMAVPALFAPGPIEAFFMIFSFLVLG